MIDAQQIEATIGEMAEDLKTYVTRRGFTAPVLIGIHTGGVWIAERLHRLLDIGEPLGALDISFYRDDFTTVGMNPRVRPSELPFEVEGRHIVLVDDVLFSGRTVRAALNEIFDYGRPASVTLVVLVDRYGRELPVEAQVIGMTMDLAANEHVKLSGPEQLCLVVQQAP